MHKFQVYSKIPDIELLDGEEANRFTPDYRKYFIFCILTLISVAAFGHTLHYLHIKQHNIRMKPNAVQPHLQFVYSRNCTFNECETSRCDVAVDPFVCIDGAAINGCSSSAAEWHSNPSCSDYCDLSFCSETIETQLNFKLCESCGRNVCDIATVFCTVDNPYFCYQGSAEYECSPDPLLWPTSEISVCRACCNSSFC